PRRRPHRRDRGAVERRPRPTREREPRILGRGAPERPWPRDEGRRRSDPGRVRRARAAPARGGEGRRQPRLAGGGGGERLNGRALATKAVAEVIPVAFGELELHRLEAGTLVDNLASRRVLEKNGVGEVGVAPGDLHIGGEWRDHMLFQLLADRGAIPRQIVSNSSSA